jgi:hypothetical protein
MSDTFVFGGHNKTTNLRIVRLQLQETGTYDTQFIRPLTTELNNITQNAILDTMPGMSGRINPYNFANLAGSFLQRSATPESAVTIPNGWNERRLRFLMEVTFDFQTGGTSTHYYMGYTDYTGITNNSAIDPNLRFYINAKIVTRKGLINTPYGRQPFENIVSSNQVLQNFNEPSIYRKPTVFGMRPSEVYTYMLDSFTNNNLANDSYDFRAVINNTGATVDRKLCTPAHFGAEIFNNIYEQKLLTEEGSNTRGKNLTIESIEKAKANYINDGVESSRGGPNWNDPFLVALSNITSNLAGNSFTYNNLVDLDPNIYNVIFYNKLSQEGLRQVNQTGLTQHWGGSDISTKAAAALSHTIPALMLENMLMMVGFISTNREFGGAITTRIFDYNGFGDGDLTEYFNRFILAVEKLVINEISINNMLSYYIRVTADVIGETRIDVSIDNEPVYTYVAPSFSDGIFSPLITNSYNNICAVGSDFMMLYDSMNNENAAMTGSKYNLI